MSTWVTHLMVVDRLYQEGLPLEERGFCVGSVGPDCNVENDDWTAFTPSREATHWMTERNNKLSTDYEGFRDRYVLPRRETASPEEYAFLLGYYAHLITDVEAQRTWRDPARIHAIYRRLQTSPELWSHIEGRETSMDVLKAVFGKGRLTLDLAYLERDYLRDHPGSKFETVLRHVKDFPDYLDYFPQGAFTRKLRVIDSSCDFSRLGPTPNVLYFYSREELRAFVDKTSRLLAEKLAPLL